MDLNCEADLPQDFRTIRSASMAAVGDDVPDGAGRAERKLSISPVDRNDVAGSSSVALAPYGFAVNCIDQADHRARE